MSRGFSKFCRVQISFGNDIVFATEYSYDKKIQLLLLCFKLERGADVDHSQLFECFNVILVQFLSVLKSVSYI